MKEKLKKIMIKRFGDFKKIILFRNPKEFSYMYIERINPNHVGIIWGRRRKHLNKGTGFIKVGKIYFGLIPIIYGLSVTASISLYALLVIGFYSIIAILLYYITFELPFAISRKYTPCQI